MSPLALSIIQLVSVFAIAPLAVGIRQFCLARLQGRQGMWPWLAYTRLLQLLQQENLVSRTQSWISRGVPYVVFGIASFLTLVLPLVSLGGVLASLSNFLLVTVVIVMGSLALVLAALDSGQSLAGVSAGRYLTMSSLWLPALFLIFAALAVATEQAAVDGMLTVALRQGNYLTQAPYLLVSILALLLVALADNFRYPVDSPGSAYEFSSMYDNLIGHYSGPYLMLLEYAGAVRYTVFALLVANLLFPVALLTSASGLGQVLLVWVMVMGKVLVVSGGVAILEMTIARLRFYRIQEFLTGVFFLALTGLALTLLADLL